MKRMCLLIALDGFDLVHRSELLGMKRRRPRNVARISICLFILLILATVLLSVDVSGQGTDGTISGALIVTWEARTRRSGGSILHLYCYEQGGLRDLWSTHVGSQAVSFNDINGDGEPEIVVVGGGLLIYSNLSGEYELLLNESGSINMVRGRMIDYYGNGTQFLICPHSGKLCLVGYRSGRPAILEYLPYPVSGQNGFDVGDLNSDGKIDIAYGHRNGLVVLENQGKGNYVKREMITRKPSIIEMRIGDVDRDGSNEIVLVGRGPPTICIYDYVDGECEELWIYKGKQICSVDVGDVDGDGWDEVVTGNEHHSHLGTVRGVSIWKYQPEIVYQGLVLEPGGFSRVWEEEDLAAGTTTDLSLVVSSLEAGGSRIIGVGPNPGWSEVSLYVAGICEDGYDSMSIPLWTDGRPACLTLDVWTNAKIQETRLMPLITITSCLILFFPPWRRTDCPNTQAPQR